MAGTTHSHRRVAGPVRAFTLIEIMVVIAIIATLIGIGAFSVSAVHEWGRKNTAKQQLALLANAIDQYAESWKRWEVQAGAAGRVVIAEKGWPDFIPGRLFWSNNIGGPYQQLTDPDNVPFNDHLTYSLSPNDPLNSGVDYDTEGREVIVKGDVEAGAEALFYALTSSALKGPFVDESTMKANLQVTHETERYPAKTGTGTASSDLKRGEFVDPWGKPYRYFWIYRDPVPSSSNARSINGFLAVDYGAFRAGTADGGVGNPAFNADPSSGYLPKTAVGYVIESAGPDGNFGNVWQPANQATTQEIDDADDNLVLRVP